MNMNIKINELTNQTKLTKISNGVNIFNKMLSEYKKDTKITKFILDFEGIQQCTVFVFKEVIRQMQSRLKGEFGLELINGTPLVVQQFNLSLR